MRSFKSLSEQEVLCLAISLEEEHARTYADYAESLRANYPSTADLLNHMSAEEDGHRHRLIELHRARFGEHIPLIRRQDVKGFVAQAGLADSTPGCECRSQASRVDGA